MLKRFIFALILVFSVMSAGVVSAAEKYINGIDASYPPHAYVDKNGKPAGFDVDAMDWIAARMGFQVEHVPMNWDTIVVSLLTKKIDMVCSGMSISPERKAVVSFSEPYYSVRKYLMVLRDSSLTREQILRGNRKLGVQRGTNEAEWLETNKKANNWNFELVYYGTAPMAIEDLVNKRIDAAAVDSAPADDAMNRGKMPIRVAGEFADSDDFGVATRNEDAAMRDKINKGFELLKQDPYWDELKIKHDLH